MNAEARKTHYLTFGDLKVELVRSRVKNVNLRVRRDGSVRVSAPARMPVSEVKRFVASKLGWIEEHRRMVAERTGKRPELWADGERVMVWGEELVLRVVGATGRQREAVERQGDVAAVTVRERWLGQDETSCAHRQRLYEAWLKRELVAAAEPLFARYEAQIGVRSTALRVRTMKSRWGSCNTRTGAITLNLELAQLPPACLESVVVHELCHLVEANHGSRFYALMDRHYPAWREVRAMLKAAARQ